MLSFNIKKWKNDALLEKYIFTKLEEWLNSCGYKYSSFYCSCRFKWLNPYSMTYYSNLVRSYYSNFCFKCPQCFWGSRGFELYIAFFCYFEWRNMTSIIAISSCMFGDHYVTCLLAKDYKIYHTFAINGTSWFFDFCGNNNCTWTNFWCSLTE